jgi:hypothetical protein
MTIITPYYELHPLHLVFGSDPAPAAAICSPTVMSMHLARIRHCSLISIAVTIEQLVNEVITAMRPMSRDYLNCGSCRPMHVNRAVTIIAAMGVKLADPDPLSMCPWILYGVRSRPPLRFEWHHVLLSW